MHVDQQRFSGQGRVGVADRQPRHGVIGNRPHDALLRLGVYNRLRAERRRRKEQKAERPPAQVATRTRAGPSQ